MSSSPNLDFVRSIVAGWERGDFGSVRWAAAEIELVVADGPEPVDIRGLRATLEYWRKRPDSWRGSRLVGDGYRELNEERVLVIVHANGGRDGVELAHHGGGGAVVFTVRAGEVTRLGAYFDRERAFADLGLSE